MSLVSVGKLSGQELRDALLQLLYDRGRMATSEITSALPPYRLYSVKCGHADCSDANHRLDLGTRNFDNTTVTQQLTKLVKAELIVKGPKVNGELRQGWTWWPVDWQPPEVVEPVERDDDAERVMAALMGSPPRMSWDEYRARNYRAKPGHVTSEAVGRARGRALSRLAAAHRGEFEILCREEQWKIARGETQ